MLHMGKHSRSSFSLWKKELVAGTSFYFIFFFSSTAPRHTRITRGTASMEALLYVAFSSDFFSLLPCRRADLSYLVKVRTNRIFFPPRQSSVQLFCFFRVCACFSFHNQSAIFQPSKKRKGKKTTCQPFLPGSGFSV